MVGGLNYHDLCTCKEIHFVRTADGGFQDHEDGCGCTLTKEEYIEMKEQITKMQQENALLKKELERLALLHKDHQQNCMPIRYKANL
jgi:hypothetical protein